MHLLAVARMAVRSLLAFAGLAAAKPNFVVLFVDDMGINQVAVDKSIYASQVYGYTGDSGTIATPNVARLLQTPKPRAQSPQTANPEPYTTKACTLNLKP